MKLVERFELNRSIRKESKIFVVVVVSGNFFDLRASCIFSFLKEEVLELLVQFQKLLDVLAKDKREQNVWQPSFKFVYFLQPPQAG